MSSQKEYLESKIDKHMQEVGNLFQEINASVKSGTLSDKDIQRLKTCKQMNKDILGEICQLPQYKGFAAELEQYNTLLFSKYLPKENPTLTYR